MFGLKLNDNSKFAASGAFSAVAGKRQLYVKNPRRCKFAAVFCFPEQKPYIWHMEKFKQGLPYLISGLLAGFMTGLALQSIFNIL